MKNAYKIFTIFGISINIHITFLMLPVLFFVTSGLKGVFLVIFVFSCVTAHELFHSIAAKRFGIRVNSITLFPIGGVASIGSFPEKPMHEFLIALAGPVFNILFAVVMFFPLYRILGPDVLFRPSMNTWPHTFAEAFWVNPSLAAFNLLPAFPMDGGRILRAFLSQRLGLRKATQIAVGIGHFFAVVFVFIGITYGHFMLIVVAAFIYMAASSENVQVGLREAVKSYRAIDILDRQFSVVDPNTAVSKILEFMVKTFQGSFPVMENDRLIGFLTHEDVLLNVQRVGQDIKVRDIMRTSFPVAYTDEPLMTVRKKMTHENIKAIPVMKGDQVLGVISLDDINRICGADMENGGK